MANQKDIIEITSLIGETYTNFQPTAKTIEVYYQILKDIDPNELKAAVLHCISQADRKFAPTVGEIRGAVGDLRRSSANVPGSYQAWEEVQNQILINGGDFGSPVWSHPLIGKAVKAIGWRNLRMSENQTADRARFIQAYEQLETRMMKEEMLLPEVRGYIESKGGKMLEAPMDAIRQLAKGFSK
jgi:hypothetical protein